MSWTTTKIIVWKQSVSQIPEYGNVAMEPWLMVEVLGKNIRGDNDNNMDEQVCDTTRTLLNGMRYAKTKDFIAKRIDNQIREQQDPPDGDMHLNANSVSMTSRENDPLSTKSPLNR